MPSRKASFHFLSELRLRFPSPPPIPAFHDAEAELGNESLWMNHQDTDDERKIRTKMVAYKILQRPKGLSI